MWRWPVVARKKEATAQARAKINTLHAKLITLAAEKWSDPTLNTSLADAVSTARKEWVPADVIERAIRRGSGLDKDALKVEEIFYEGYAPGGVAVIVRAVTDNRNRTAPNIRHIFSAFGGSLGETGSVSSFLFEYKWTLTLDVPNDVETFEMMILETEAENYEIADGKLTVTTSKGGFLPVREALIKAGYTLLSAELWYVSKNAIEVSDFDTVLKIYKMLEEFGEDEDVETVWNNAEIADTLWKEVETFVESKKFRT
jgi:YebC/PmpR family DNA-binding regulatory protein